MYFNADHGANKRLICFPFEGGSSHFFRDWSKVLGEYVEVAAIELPGRGRRISERLYYKLPGVIHEILPSMLPLLDKPFYFFGHGLGALIAFEMTAVLRKSFLPEPDHLFVSSISSPQVKKEVTYNLSKDKFLNKLKEMNKIPSEVLKDRDLVDLMYPILKADFSVSETYSYKAGFKIDCPITAFGGLSDINISLDEIQAWAEVTNSSFELNLLPGGHFFIIKSEGMFLKVLQEKLSLKKEGVNPL
ncbi:MAG: thioesterase II family protein [Acidobacteriota bacterium]